MNGAPVRHARRIAALMACLCVAACAGSGRFQPSPQGPGSARGATGLSIAPQLAMDMIAIGRSTKADVLSALGEAIVIRFDSGYEVWVYRWAGTDPTRRAATELVVLFEPSGMATKVRVRPGYETRD